MARQRFEAASIAKLSGTDGRIIGWVLLWDNAELSVLWLGDDYAPVEIAPPIDARILEAAKGVCTDSITELLETLSAKMQRGLGKSSGSHSA